jgi:hypothetical protein
MAIIWKVTGKVEEMVSISNYWRCETRNRKTGKALQSEAKYLNKRPVQGGCE